MSICRILATIPVLSAVVATTPASAQQVMSEPAYCAFFYPTANCQNKGPGNPYTDPNYRRNGVLGSGAWSGGTTVGVAPPRQRTPRSLDTARRLR
jgi:hypothetical protein